ncbi:MAG: lectin-like protein, partial [Armatimonadota bacterium]
MQLRQVHPRAQAVTIAIGVLAIVSATAARADYLQWSGNGHWYEAVYVEEGITWEGARTAAASTGGYLATILSSEENTFAYNLVSEDKYWFWGGAGNGIGPWLGGYQDDDENWLWVTGETWGYTNWGPSQPNNLSGTQDYLDFYGNNTLKSSKWNDHYNDAGGKGY